MSYEGGGEAPALVKTRFFNKKKCFFNSFTSGGGGGVNPKTPQKKTLLSR